MILTGSEITKRVESGEIVISPFRPENVNPNSYNFTVAPELRVYEKGVIDVKSEKPSKIITIGKDGYVLKPRQLYLASTIEVMGSKHFVPTYAARSSVARLGMFINLSAPLGDIGSERVGTRRAETDRGRAQPGVGRRTPQHRELGVGRRVHRQFDAVVAVALDLFEDRERGLINIGGPQQEVKAVFHGV